MADSLAKATAESEYRPFFEVRDTHVLTELLSDAVTNGWLPIKHGLYQPHAYPRVVDGQFEV